MTSPAPEPLGGYAWPPQVIEDPEAAATRLAERLQEAWSDLETQRLRLLAGLSRAGELSAANLSQYQAALEEFMDRVDANVREFLDKHLVTRYAAGVLSALPSGSMMNWSAIHVTALTSVATDTYEDFLARAREAQVVSETMVQAIRRAAGSEIPKALAGGRTAQQAGTLLSRRLMEQYGIDFIRYADGSRVTVHSYSQMAARTKSAVAYNAGTLNEVHSQGVRYVEVFDGADCGWQGHGDSDKANGTIRTVAQAAQYVVAHPNCRRAFGGRPDITSREEADAANSSVAPSSAADQAAFERRAAR